MTSVSWVHSIWTQLILKAALSASVLVLLTAAATQTSEGKRYTRSHTHRMYLKSLTQSASLFNMGVLHVLHVSV